MAFHAFHTLSFQWPALETRTEIEVAANPVNEMVRRLVSTEGVGDGVGRFMEDHRYADSFGWHRPRQDYVSPSGSQRSRQGAVAEEVHSEATTYIHRELADVSDRAGGVFRRALSRPCSSRARSRCEANPSSVCEAVCEVEQERLLGCRSHRRGGRSAEHALCADQDGRPT